MYSIVGIDKKTYGEGIGITYIHTRKDSVQNKDPTYLGPVLVKQRPHLCGLRITHVSKI